MSTSYSLHRNGQSNHSFASDNDSKSDDDDDDDDDNAFYKKGTMRNDNDMLERPSDDDDDHSRSQSDVTENDDRDDNKKENDLLTSANNPLAHYLTRQVTLYENDWPPKGSVQERQSRRTLADEATSSAPSKSDPSSYFDSLRHRMFSSEQSQPIGMTEKRTSRSPLSSSLANEYVTSEHQRQLMPQASPIRRATATSRSNRTIPSTTTGSNVPSPSKIPIRTTSSSKSRSRSPAPTRRIASPIVPSKIPIPVSSLASQGAFRFFTADDRPSPGLEQVPSSDSSSLPSAPSKQFSPFTPIDHRQIGLPSSSSAGHTPMIPHRHGLREISEDEDTETSDLKESDLKVKLKQQKRHGKETGQLLNQLHENYNDLLEKYAQAENTIDQLRFQPKFTGDNSTPPSYATEGAVHFIQQPSMNMVNVRSSAMYPSTSGSSILPRPSTTTTSTRKSTSPANSGTIESVFFDEAVGQKIIVEELTTPETLKLDLLLQTKTLSDKMKSFLTLMDANQLSLAEQKQVYENIKEDYEKLLKAVDRKKNTELDLDLDLNDELETMKQVLKEIVKRITDNLLGKSSYSSETGRHGHSTRDESHSSQVSVRSSLCNHAELMDQYKKLLSAVNTEIEGTKKPLQPGLPSTTKISVGRLSPVDLSDRRPTTKSNPKPYVYTSGNSDDEQIPSRDMKSYSAGKHGQPTSFNLDSNQYYQQVDEEQAHIRGLARETKKKSSTDELDSQGYDNLENLTKPKRKAKGEEKKFTHEYQRDQELSPSTLSIPTGPVRSSAGSMRTRTSDYDSGFGTHNTTKLSRDSKLNTSTMDESHYQSLDEEQRERRRCSDDADEQDSMTSVTSSRSSGSGAASLGTYSNKYTKRFNSSSPLKPHRETHRRKPSGHSDGYPSDIETHITGSFDPLPPPPPSSSSFAIYQPRKSRRQHHSWQPQRTVSLRSGSTPHHRSVSIESLDNRSERTPYHRPQTAPSISSKVTDPRRHHRHHQMGRKYESGLVHRPSVGSKHPERMYQSSVFIGEPHTHRRSQEALHQQQYYERLQTPSKQPTYGSPNHRLYLDPQTGMIYRYESKRNPTPSNTYYSPSSQVKSSAELYKCVQCGSMTNYQHRHHINSPTRRVPTEFDDPGYESGHKRSKQRRRPIERVASSGSDTDEASTFLDMAMLNEACERAEKVQHRSQNLSRHISRQLKLLLSTM